MPTNFSKVGNYKNRTFTSDIMQSRTIAPEAQDPTSTVKKPSRKERRAMS